MDLLIISNINESQNSAIFFELRDTRHNVYGVNSIIDYISETKTLYINVSSKDFNIKSIVKKHIDGNSEIIQTSCYRNFSSYVEEIKDKIETINMKSEKSKVSFPINFLTRPSNSVLQKCEAEIVAQNIMVILDRTNGVFRELTWEEYKIERIKDKGFRESEKLYFDKVQPYTISGEMANSFSVNWYEDISHYEKIAKDQASELKRLKEKIKSAKSSISYCNKMITKFESIK